MSDPSTILTSRSASSTWNFVGDAPLVTLVYDAAAGEATAVAADGSHLLHTTLPFAALAWMERYDLTATPDARWVGYIGYEFARQIEALPATAVDDLRLPTFVFRLCRPTASRDASPTTTTTGETTLRPRSMSRDAHLAAVNRILNYIAAGDVFQINLAQRLSFATSLDAATIFDALCRVSPPDFGALLAFDDFALASNSPELFFRIEPIGDGRRRIVSRPIKGTRPLAPGMVEELAASAKDRAELAMIVDLQRNDLGRVCEIGSVVVTEPRVIETHPTLYHGVATIEGMLRRDAGFADVVRALFPCGSITGCPKVRAMEIIDALEPVARGPYCGAIGYLAPGGAIEFNVAIRTMVVKDGVAHAYVGGGIVADSVPAEEYEETLVKARAMLAALGVSAADIASLRER